VLIDAQAIGNWMPGRGPGNTNSVPAWDGQVDDPVDPAAGRAAQASPEMDRSKNHVNAAA
jgi:hypothetical protein